MRIWPTTTAEGPTWPWVGLRLGVFRLRESTLEYLDRLKGGGPQGVSNVLTDYMPTGLLEEEIVAE